MSRELWLLRHGKAHRDLDVNDFERPLKKRGEQDVERIGVWMKQHGHIPDVVLSSPAKRAIDTARWACKTLGLPEQAIVQDRRLYFYGREGLREVLADQLVKQVLLVGHNPDLEELLVYLAGAVSVPSVDNLLPTAALARLRLPDDWRKLDAGCAELVSITYAKSLQDVGL